MNTERIKEIQQETAYPESISVQQALLKVWNECEQEKAVKNNAVSPLISSISSMNKAMKEFLSGIDEELEKDQNNKIMQGAKWAYSIAISQFYNRFSRYCQ